MDREQAGYGEADRSRGRRGPQQELPAAAVANGETIDFNGAVTVACGGQRLLAPKTTPASMKKPTDLMKLLGADAKVRPGRTSP